MSTGKVDDNDNDGWRPRLISTMFSFFVNRLHKLASVDLWGKLDVTPDLGRIGPIDLDRRKILEEPTYSYSYWFSGIHSKPNFSSLSPHER